MTNSDRREARAGRRDNGAMQCRICGSRLEARGAVSCMKCGAAFHRDCWLFNGQCGIYGCGCRTYVGFRSGGSSVIAIDENTRVNVRDALRPYVEGIMRTLPRWGRSLIPTLSVGLTGALVVAVFYFSLTGFTFTWLLAALFFGCGAFSALISIPLGGPLRRNPVFVSGLFGSIAVLLYYLSRLFYNEPRAFLVISAVVASMVTCNALVERLCAPYRYSPSPGPVAMTAIRTFLTGVFLFIMLSLMTVVFGPRPFAEFAGEIACVALFGFFVAAPPMELSKSAMIERAKRTAQEMDG